jgi:hypothetical protein
MLDQESIQLIMLKFEWTIRNAPKPVIPEFVLTVIELLKMPNSGLRRELI